MKKKRKRRVIGCHIKDFDKMSKRTQWAMCEMMKAAYKMIQKQQPPPPEQ